MNREIRDQWTAALRSGDYAQGRGALHAYSPTGGRYCCLGVLCELAVEAGAVGVKNGYNNEKRYGAASQGGVLPREVMAWAGMIEADASDEDAYHVSAGQLEKEVEYRDALGFRGVAMALTELNDGGQYSFNDIADVIEAQF